MTQKVIGGHGDDHEGTSVPNIYAIGDILHVRHSLLKMNYCRQNSSQEWGQYYCKRIIFGVYDILQNMTFQQVSVDLILRISESTYLSSYIFYIWRCT